MQVTGAVRDIYVPMHDHNYTLITLGLQDMQFQKVEIICIIAFNPFAILIQTSQILAYWHSAVF